MTSIFDAIDCDDDVEVERLLDDETLSFTSRDYRGATFLGAAISYPFKLSVKRARIITLLADAPYADFSDSCTPAGFSPLFFACFHGDDYPFRVFFDDPRADPHAAKIRFKDRCYDVYPLGKTALYYAIIGGNINIVKWWIASERPLIVDPTLKDQSLEMREAALRVHNWMISVTLNNKQRIYDLLNQYAEQPAATVHMCRLDTGWCGPMAAAVFALVVFLCDGLLQSSGNVRFLRTKDRFFRIATKLPMELQMVLCNVVAGSGATIIQSQHTEPAFAALARALYKNTTYRRVLDLEHLVEKE
jgi:hypothetical protein